MIARANAAAAAAAASATAATSLEPALSTADIMKLAQSFGKLNTVVTAREHFENVEKDSIRALANTLPNPNAAAAYQTALATLWGAADHEEWEERAKTDIDLDKYASSLIATRIPATDCPL